MKNEDSLKLKDVGERGFLKKIASIVDETELGFNEDASAFSLPSKDLLVMNIDMLVNKTDVLPGMSYEQMGKKAVTMSVSDVIAKGAQPQGCLVSLGVPGDTQVKDAYELLEGVKKQCNFYDILFLGGDLNETDDMIVDVFSFGVCKSDQVISRKGVQDGDIIYSTGLFGLTSLAFQILLENQSVSGDLREQSLNSVYEPKARIDVLELFKQLPIKVCMDSSDGLLVTLYELSQINKMGIEIDNVPIHQKVLEFSLERESNPLDYAFKGGEEFELIFAVGPEIEDSLKEKAEKLRIRINQIGSFKKSIDGIKIRDSRLLEYELPDMGFEHFRK